MRLKWLSRKWWIRKWRVQKWQYLHRSVQFLFLGLFLYLFVRLEMGTSLPIPPNLFSRFDPLLALNSMLAARQFIWAFIPALVILLIITPILGRVWCGWLCPLGAILDLFGPRGRRSIPRWFRQVKYFILIFILIAALSGTLTLIFFDPLTIFIRGLDGIRGLITASRSWLVLALPFIIILALNLFARRFWCRYLCPLGALLGLISKVAWLKRRVSKDRCLKCAFCARRCPMGAINEEDFTSDPGECIQCLDCLPCPARAISFNFGRGQNREKPKTTKVENKV